MITPAFRLGLRFCKALPAPCVEGFERRASAWCRTGGPALGRTPRSCVLARFLPRLFRMRCYLLVPEAQRKLGTATHACRMLLARA